MPVGQAVEVPHTGPDTVIAGIDDRGYVDSRHGASAFLARAALGGRFGRWCLRRRWRGLVAPTLAGRIPHTLCVTRLADQARHLGEPPAFDADIGEDGV